MKPKLYLETTIPSYLAGRPSRDLLVAAHQQITRDWWEWRRAEFDLYASELVVLEALAGTSPTPNYARQSGALSRHMSMVRRLYAPRKN